MRVYEHEPESLIEEYQIFKICQLYEYNLRKQDKNYKYGEAFLNIDEEEQNFNKDMYDILKMIKEFWNIIAYFDGSTKFLSLILKISHSISNLEESYLRYFNKYDEEITNFKYIMDLFRTIILN